MEFWIFSELISDISNGVTVLWDLHVGIVIMKSPSGNLGAYVFPQAYSVPTLGTATGTAVSSLQTGATNAILVDMGSSIQSGTWIWVRCAVSYLQAKYYFSYNTIGGTQVNNVNTLNAEILYNTIRNDYPLRYFFVNGKTTSIFVRNISTQTKKIFIRNLYAFNDYLPVTYNFQYM